MTGRAGEVTRSLNRIEAALTNAKTYPSNFETMPQMMVQDALRELDEAIKAVNVIRQSLAGFNS